ncbi:SDR family oxidoreductase [Celerinatantimonas sp. YJH-8]|uniref:SDR family oxidoreductase n=1 Tax=Celerinatantimonas sp. YJH-8 TaxID=3228714 RepID=UPI0038C7DCA9
MLGRVLVTGASSGIGLAISQYLLKQGWQVLGMCRSKPPIEHPQFSLYQLDLSDSAAIAATLAELPPMQAFVHAAGMMAAAPLGQLDLALGERLWKLHISAAEQIANHLVGQFSAGSRIVLIGSRTSCGVANRSQYSATKAAMVAMARSWAAELAPKGITVNVVAPSATETEMLKQPGREKSAPKLPPIGRYIQPIEIAHYVAYLLSDMGAAITGQELMICGGASL